MNENYNNWFVPNVGNEIYWELKEACKLVAGFTPHCDDDFNLNAELKPTNQRMLQKNQDIFFDFKNDNCKKVRIENRHDEYKTSSMQEAVHLNYEFVHAIDFIKWATSKEHSPPTELLELLDMKQNKGSNTNRMKMREQEKSVINKIIELGHDPMNMPPYINGKKGIKSIICTSLKNSHLFDASTGFSATWERMMSSGEISYKVQPSSL